MLFETDLGCGLRSARASKAHAMRPEELVPIRIDIEQESHRLRETFVWNMNGVALF